MAILTKSDIIDGKNNIQEVHIESLGGEIYLRPLTRGECTKIEQIQTASMGKFKTKEIAQGAKRSNMESNGVLDIKATTEATRKAELEAIYLSINNEQNDKWTKPEIESLNKAAFDEIYENVQKISGLLNEDLDKEVENFPENE